MIKEVTRDDIPVCVDIIRKSFKTVADEFGFTIDNAPRFTAFATTEERLYWQMDNEPRQMFVYEKNGVICGYYSLLMQDNNECELNNLAALPEYRHCGIGKTLLEHAYETARNQGWIRSLSYMWVRRNLLRERNLRSSFLTTLRYSASPTNVMISRFVGYQKNEITLQLSPGWCII